MTAPPPPTRVGSPTTRPHAVPSPVATAELRRRFLRDGTVPEIGLTPPILRSWTRCAAIGLDMGRRPAIEPPTAAEVRDRIDRHDRLHHAALGEIDPLGRDLGDGIVVLADRDGRVLDTRGDAAFADRAARVALRPGAVWGEATAGTNAIGTAIAERRTITVIGDEHWFDANRVLTCTAMPIFDGRGEICGVLDLTSAAEVAHAHAPALLRRTVEAIERRLFEAVVDDLDLLRLRADPDGDDRDREGVLAFAGDRLVGADRRGLALIERDWDAVDTSRWSDLFVGPRGRTGVDGRLATLRGRTLYGRIDRRPARTVRCDATPALPRLVAPVAPVATPPPLAEPAVPGLPAPVWSPRAAKALDRARRLVDADVPVLIQGETGAGKEVFARALHAASGRRDRPFVAVNCAALPEGLIEAELFGYEEGAFTGARRQGAKGLMREADGGILFLDEIGDMPLALQARLLRALQEREVMPLGAARPVRVEFALVCATHRGLTDLVAAHGFRQDLYFRIAQYTVELEPLRAHPDLPGLIDRLWHDLGGDSGGVGLSAEVRARLAGHHWPGNWRQLTATLRTLRVLAEPGETLGLDALPADLAPPCGGAGRGAPSGPAAGPAEAGASDLDTLTREAMWAALEAAGGNVARAAARLGVHRSTLYRRLPARPDEIGRSAGPVRPDGGTGRRR